MSEEKRKPILNIGISSMSVWLFMNGDMKNPIRAFADADCNVHIGIEKIEKDGKYFGEKASEKYEYVEYSPKHIIKIRTGWDEIDMEDKTYGKIKTTSYNHE